MAMLVGCSGPSEPLEDQCFAEHLFDISFVQSGTKPFVDFSSARLCSTCYVKDLGPELCHCFVIDRSCKVLEGEAQVAYCSGDPFAVHVDRATFPATDIALSIRDAEGKVVDGEMRAASVYHGPAGECSGPASVDFFVNYIPGAAGGAGGTSP
ncbi:MAG: hypothetical protein IPM35_22175 [Myxococcales bacterium]|nr:hypothetical protein [Myxococcales bacterium]